MAEQLARTHQIQHAAVVRSSSTAPLRTTRSSRDGVGLGREDDLSGAVELDLGRGGDALDRRRVERVERRMLPQEAGDLEECL